jgi:hypothetical protein
VRSASSGVEVIDNHEALQEPQVGIIQILMRNRVSFSTALSTPARLMSPLVGVRTVLGKPAFIRACVTKTLLQASNILASEDVDQENIMYSCVAITQVFDVHEFVHCDTITKITNKMQLYRLIYYFELALHVSYSQVLLMMGENIARSM